MVRSKFFVIHALYLVLFKLCHGEQSANVVEQQSLEKMIKLEKEFVVLQASFADQRVRMTEQISGHNTEIANLNSRISNQNTEIANLNARISNQNTEIANLNARIANQDTEIANSNSRIVELENDLKLLVSDQNLEIQKQTVKIMETSLSMKSEIAKQNNEITQQSLKYCELENKLDRLFPQRTLNDNGTRLSIGDKPYAGSEDVREQLELIKINQQHLQEQNASLFTLQENLRAIKVRIQGAPPIAFYARVSKAIRIQGPSIVQFDVVGLNVGGGYSEHTGVFTAPYEGNYFFAYSILPSGSDSAHMRLFQNGKKISAVYASVYSYDMSTASVIVQLSKGDQVYVKHNPSYEPNGLTLIGTYYNAFLGYRIN